MEVCRQARSQLASQEGDVGSQEGVLVEVSTNGGGPACPSEDLPSKIDRMEMSVTRTSSRKNPIACLVSRKEHHVCDEIIIDHQGTAQVQPREGMTLRSGRVLQDSKVASKNGATTIKSLSKLDVETEENITMNNMDNADLSVNPGLNMLMVSEPFAKRVSPMDVKIIFDHPSLQTEVALHATTPKGVTPPGAATWNNDKVIIEGKALTYGYVTFCQLMSTS